MNHKWTVLFLVHAATKETREYVNELFDLLTRTHYNDDVKVLVLHGGLQPSKSSGFKIQVTLKKIERNATTGMLNLKKSREFGDIDIGDDRELKKIFSSLRADHPSERFLLFSWDHGSGFGIFNTDPTERALHFRNAFPDPKKGLRNDQRDIPMSNGYGRLLVVNNYTMANAWNSRDLQMARRIEKKIRTSMLTNDELNNALLGESGSKKVDLLIMMNCAMQMIETGYALHESVEYLVAPETCIFWAGYDYTSIINKLCAQPDISTEDLGKYAVDTIPGYYANTPSAEYIDDLVVSLVKTSGSLLVKEVVDETASYLISILEHQQEKIKGSRMGCEDLTAKYVEGVPFQYVDLLHLLDSLAATTTGIDLDRIRQAIKQYVLHLLKGGNYTSINEVTNIGEVNGCTIYFPASYEVAKDDLYYDWFYKNGDQQTLFAKNGRWRSFLEKYYEKDTTIQKEERFR